ncbi:MAG: carboxypeptidase regulatory-like domain-containing protein [Halobacteriales archaeon]|nr:carboxypeptidase regulatory-like domain-containing protein [Halobacteriales archaeon]
MSRRVQRASGTDGRAFGKLLVLCAAVALLLLISMTVITATAQADSVDADTGSVEGTVYTEGGHEIPDAEVRLVDAVSDTVERTTASDSDGGYSFTSVETGTYRVEAEFKGGEGESDNVTVETGETQSRDVELRPQEDFFSVSVDGTNSPVTEGEDARVDITVTNAGEESGSQAVFLEIPGIGEDARPVNLDGGSSIPVSLGIPTDIGDAGEYTAEVRTNDDTEEVEFVVEERGTDMEVSISDTNSPVTEGETLTVEARVSNPSGVPGRGTLTAEVDGLGSDRASFSLEGGEVETKSFEIPTESGDAGEYTVTVSVGGASDSVDVTVEEDAEAGEDGDGEEDEDETDDGSEDEGGEDGDSETEETNESGTGDSATETDGSDGSGGDGEEIQESQRFSPREILRYVGIGAVVLVGFAVVVAVSVLTVRKLRKADWGGDASDGENEKPRVVLDTDSENDVYVSWSRMIERADIDGIRTKTPSEIAEEAKDAGLNPGAVDEITDVFEEVRYGEGEPTQEQKERAKRAFERL